MAHGRSQLKETAVSMKLHDAKGLLNHEQVTMTDVNSCVEITAVNASTTIMELHEVRDRHSRLLPIWAEQDGRGAAQEYPLAKLMV